MNLPHSVQWNLTGRINLNDQVPATPLTYMNNLSPQVFYPLCGSAGSSDAIQLNNFAVGLLQSHNHDEALDLFHQAWRGHGVAVHQQQSLEHQLIALSTLIMLPFPLPVIMRPSLMLLERQQTTIQSVPADESGGSTSVGVAEDLDLSASPSNFFSVFNRAFVFKEQRSAALDWYRRQRLLPAVLLYNMALTYHRRALHHVNADEYARAFEFYKMSLCAVEENLHAGVCSSDYCLLRLALYNNLGYLSSHFFNESETISYGGRMLATFASVDCTRLLSKEEYVFFYMNLLFLLNRHPLCAPAA